MRLLQESRRDQGAVFFQVRLVKVKPSQCGEDLDEAMDETMEKADERPNVEVSADLQVTGRRGGQEIHLLLFFLCCLLHSIVTAL